MQELTANEKALETLMHDAANKPQTRGVCVWGEINGKLIRVKPVFKADGSFRGLRFAIDGQIAKVADAWAAVRA